MSKGLYYFLDSGANAHSKYTGFISWEDLGITEEEWDALTDTERDIVGHELAFGRAEWSYYKYEE